MSQNLHPTLQPKRPNAFIRYISRFDEGSVVRWAFVGVLLGTAALLGMDLREMVDRNGGLWGDNSQQLTREFRVLPPAVIAAPSADAQPNDPRHHVEGGRDLLSQPMTFALEAGGILRATGAIDPGSADRLRAELEARGEYVTHISLNSPGGSLDDAIAMARMVRERELATVVEEGAICASSCPLFFAGGINRQIDEKAAIGVHQFYAATDSITSAAQAMADAQMTTARISRHLDEMGIDPALWLHALDTPPRALYYFSPDQLLEYGLVTEPQRLARS